MFATGFLAHSLLLPFVGIILQVLVVNFWLSPPENQTKTEVPQAHAIVAAKVSASTNADSGFHFFDYFEAPSVVSKVAYPDLAAVRAYVPIVLLIRSSCGSQNHPLRAPPLAIPS